MNKGCKEARMVKGVAAIRKALKVMPSSSGVYRMIDEKGEILYVGKALNLKRRVTSYTQLSRLPERLRIMVSRTVDMEIVLTSSEAEALLLEANYIRKIQPHFNILLKDDKSYPWLAMTSGKFPRLMRYRGQHKKTMSYWGPFASSRAAAQMQQVMERSFLLRTCSDSVMNSRTRPCLLYQIKRCSAPCVDRISEHAYKKLVTEGEDFLNGRGQALQVQLTKEMEKASEEMAYERAALIRDRIRSFASIIGSGSINPITVQEADVFALWKKDGKSCIQVIFIRGGCNNGNRAFFPIHDPDESEEEILSSFIVQFYNDKYPPKTIFLDRKLDDIALIEEALTLQREKKVHILIPQQGEKKKIIDHAIMNAREALSRKLAEMTGQKELLLAVQKLFSLPHIPKRIEVYDNSHIMGQLPYGVMIVGGEAGFDKRSYRKYAIKSKDITPGDDFGMMREVMTRRFAPLIAAQKAQENEGSDKSKETLQWPDMLLIDGGKGQVSAVGKMLRDMGINNVPVIGIAKGPDRNAGREWFVREGFQPFQLPERDPVLFYLQRLRDESHRFAITTHRTGRSNKLVHSKLDDIPNIGPSRKKALITRFGSVRNVSLASVENLAAVPGISQETAKIIYGYFHPDWLEKENLI